VGLTFKPISNAPQFRNFALPYYATWAVDLHFDATGFIGPVSQVTIFKCRESSSNVFEYQTTRRTQCLHLVLTSQDGGQSESLTTEISGFFEALLIRKAQHSKT
jgi:hypothetical protein